MTAGVAIRPGPRAPASRPARALRRPGSGWLKRYQLVLMAAALAAIFTNLPIYLYMLDARLLPKFMYFGIVFLILPLMLVHYRHLGSYLASPFALWAILLLVLNLIHFAGHPGLLELGGVELIDTQGEARRSLISTRAQYLVFALFLGFVLHTGATRSALWVLVPVTILLPCAVMLDFTSPGLLYPPDTPGAVFGRAGAMFINPNLAGEAILLSFLLACAVTGAAWRVPLFLLAGAGALATFSRATILAWIMILLILVSRKTLPKSALLATAVALAIVLVYVGSFESYLHSRQEFDDASSNILARLNFFSSYSFDDDSSEERASVMQAGWELFLQNPIFGAGAGATISGRTAAARITSCCCLRLNMACWVFSCGPGYSECCGKDYFSRIRVCSMRRHVCSCSCRCSPTRCSIPPPTGWPRSQWYRAGTAPVSSAGPASRSSATNDRKCSHEHAYQPRHPASMPWLPSTLRPGARPGRAPSCARGRLFLSDARLADALSGGAGRRRRFLNRPGMAGARQAGSRAVPARAGATPWPASFR